MVGTRFFNSSSSSNNHQASNPATSPHSPLYTTGNNLYSPDPGPILEFGEEENHPSCSTNNHLAVSESIETKAGSEEDTVFIETGGIDNSLISESKNSDNMENPINPENPQSALESSTAAEGFVPAMAQPPPEQDPQELAKIKRKYVLQELLETERDYVTDLSKVVEGYIANISSMELPEDLQGKDKIIFANISQIREFHRDNFLKEIEKCEDNYEIVAHAFVKYERRLQTYYVKYCQNKPKSDYLVSQEAFEQFFAETKLKLGHKVALSDLLIKPVQRIMKYQLLLKDIMKYTERAGDPTIMMQKALEVMHTVPKLCDDMMSVGRLQNFDGNLNAQGKLLFHGALQISDSAPGQLFKGKERRIFLFEQSAIIADCIMPKKEFSNPTYIFKNQIMVNKMVLEANIADDPLRFVFRSNEPSSSSVFVAQANSAEEKAQWIQKIMCQLDQQKTLLAALVDPKRYQNSLNAVHSLSLGEPTKKHHSNTPTISAPASAGIVASSSKSSSKGSKLFGFGKKSSNSVKSPTSPPPAEIEQKLENVPAPAKYYPRILSQMPPVMYSPAINKKVKCSHAYLSTDAPINLLNDNVMTMAKEGSLAVVKMSFLSKHKNIKCEWHGPALNNDVLRTSSKVDQEERKVTLLIEDAKMSDAGLYYTKIWNDFGHLNLLFPKPKAILDLTSNSHFINNLFDDFFFENSQIGIEGGTAKVFDVTCRLTFKKFAAKKFKFGMGKVDDIYREKVILANMCHTNIVGYIGIIKNQESFAIIMSRIEGFNVIRHFVEKGFISEFAIRMVGIDLLKALKYIHQRNIGHLNIKPEDILIEENKERNGFKAVLVDFGSAREITNGQEVIAWDGGSIEYVCPDVLEHRPSLKSDIWSLGVVLVMLMAGKTPFESDSSKAVKEFNIEKHDFSCNLIIQSINLNTLVTKMLVRNRKKRLDAAGCLNEDWFADKVNDSLVMVDYLQEYFVRRNLRLKTHFFD
uniref:Non-specific serine/threonine protein kinase n=1 Tax=Rhabditophanes sp. KR3021 TaxID=114890 RepID=A0AC35TTZ7_9BILA